MNELPKDIDTEKELLKYSSKGYSYTIDKFIKDYKISERTAKELLKDIDHIRITQRLYRKLKMTFGRKKFYDELEVFKELVLREKIIFDFKYAPIKKIEGVKAYIDWTKSSQHLRVAHSKNIPTSIVLKHHHFFRYILIFSSAGSEVLKYYYGYKLDNRIKRNFYNDYNKLEGVEIRINKGIRRLYVFHSDIRPQDELYRKTITLELVNLKMEK